MPSDVLIAEGSAASAYKSERAELIERNEELQTANVELRAIHKEFEDELTIAARLQRYLEPNPTVWGRVRVDTFSQPARTIGGGCLVVWATGSD